VGILEKGRARHSPAISPVDRQATEELTRVAVELRRVSTVPSTPDYSEAGAVDKPCF
jgi:hypothetical protein